MEVFAEPREFAGQNQPVSLAIGVFDGVHVGHQELIGDMVARARGEGATPVVVTFDPHPHAIVHPERTPAALQRLRQRLHAIEALGVAACWVVRFDRDFSRRTGEAFARSLKTFFPQLRRIHVGSRFTFGHRRSGNVELLARVGAEVGYAVEPFVPVRRDGEVVSSSRLRKLIQEGDLAGASRLLGRPWSLAGMVERGRGLGHTIGVPTANVSVGGLVLPPLGVYAAWAGWDGQRAPAAVNLGRRPTVAVAGDPVRVEAHLLDVSPSLYGRELELEFLRLLRPERRFDSLDALTAQIRQDIQATRAACRTQG